MKARKVSGMLEALRAISPYFLTFYTAFEDASRHGTSYFEQEGDSFDLHLHAHLVRFRVQRFLEQHDLKTEIDLEDLTNSGIQLTIGNWFIRMRKSSHGAVPKPGRSIRSKSYYQDAYPQSLSDEFGEMCNLLLLWHATPKGEFKGLSLVYPLAGINKWRHDIPHPAEAAGGKIVYQAEFDEDGNIEDMGDLEIEPLIDNEEDSEAENQ
ncbi:MAG: hypothetical protein NVS2B12_32990 [Ktedonobacteraceae bacterium]